MQEKYPPIFPVIIRPGKRRWRVSIWYEIKDPDDVDLSDDKRSVDVLFNHDHNGNNYVTIPVKFLFKLLKDVEECQNNTTPNKSKHQ